MKQQDAGPRLGALSIEAVTKRYGDLYAARAVSLDVQAGEFVTLLGPSGSGKTTLLRMVAGFTEPDSGTISVDGREIVHIPPYKRDIGMVFQNYALFPHMTASDNIAFPLKMRRVARDEIRRRVREVLELVRLEGLGDRLPSQLSGGQQQRVALARAVVFEPTVLLMDEPLGALDKKLREALELEIVRISRRLAVTVMYVTHDQEEALVMSDRIAILNHGEIEQIGTSSELYERPVSLFVAQFMGESNIFQGPLERDGRSVAVASPTGAITVSQETVDRVGLARGANVAVVVRPERLILRSARRSPEVREARPSGVSGFIGGVVREVTYLGADRKYLIETPLGQTLQARVQAGQENDDLVAGDSVEVMWRHEHGVCVPAPVAAAATEAEPLGVAASAAPV